jgi:hypothetical protein
LIDVVEDGDGVLVPEKPNQIRALGIRGGGDADERDIR